MSNVDILKRLYHDYTGKFLNKIMLSVFFSILLAGSTSSIAYLLDPAIEKIFIEKNQSLIFIIPALIITAFTVKGLSLYAAKVIMLGVAAEVSKNIQSDMLRSLIKADTQLIDNKHSGKFVANLTNDVNMITNLVSVAILNLFKDSLTLIGLLGVMFFQNWKLSLIALIMIPLASFAARKLGKRIGKISTQQMEDAGNLNTFLMEIFKNHKLIKIFQKEIYENSRAEKFLNAIKEKNRKIGIVFVRASPIMEVLTGIMIALLIFYSGKLIMSDELNINNFFSFLAAMMLAYQPVRSLATLNIAINQGLASAKRILPIIDTKNKIIDHKGSSEIKLINGDINFKDINFEYASNETQVLKSINLAIQGGKMTSLVGHSGAGKSTILNLLPSF